MEYHWQLVWNIKQLQKISERLFSSFLVLSFMCFDWQKHLVLAFMLVGFGAFDVESDGAAAYGAGQ